MTLQVTPFTKDSAIRKIEGAVQKTNQKTAEFEAYTTNKGGDQTGLGVGPASIFFETHVLTAR